jgi:fatty-acyl-CoA synthase
MKMEEKAMKICFSTLGCPRWKWGEILAVAKDLGYDGVEVRGLESEIFAPRAEPFREGRRIETKKNLEKMGLDIACFTSFCLLYHDDKDFYYREGIDYINLAADMGCPYVRVLGDKEPQPGENIDIEQVAEMLKRLGDYAATKGVTILIETNGVFADSALLKKMIKTVDSQGVGVLWDVQHPYVFFNESPEQTYQNIGEYIQHVHIKDSVVEDGAIQYKLLGAGQLPLKAVISTLKQHDYQNYLSLEWVKRWYYDLEEPGIVFAQAISKIKQMINQ